MGRPNPQPDRPDPFLTHLKLSVFDPQPNLTPLFAMFMLTPLLTIKHVAWLCCAASTTSS